MILALVALECQARKRFDAGLWDMGGKLRRIEHGAYGAHGFGYLPDITVMTVATDDISGKS